jgi:hypothetical protein
MALINGLSPVHRALFRIGRSLYFLIDGGGRPQDKSMIPAIP